MLMSLTNANYLKMEKIGQLNFVFGIYKMIGFNHMVI